MNRLFTKQIPARFQSWKAKLDRWSVPAKVSFFVLGIASTIWFLVRVIPKPSRAGYPCMRTAAPFMSAFVVYLIGITGSFLAFRHSRALFQRSRVVAASAFLVVALVLVAFSFTNQRNPLKASVKAVTVLPDGANNPMGTALGIFPGRVVWAWDANATDQNCTNSNTDPYYNADNVNQAVIDAMMDSIILDLSGEATVADGWDAIFKWFNNKKGLGSVGYSNTQTIFIKINQGTASWLQKDSDLSRDYATAWKANYGAVAETSPAAVLAVLKHLVNVAGVPQDKIYVGDPKSHIFKHTYDLLHSSFPNVKYFDRTYTTLGRTKTIGLTDDPVIYWSDEGDDMPEAIEDYLDKELNNANYLINIAALKAHARAGVTTLAKNHFGSHGRSSAEHLHDGLIAPENDIVERDDYGVYRVLTDIMGHEKIGRNTIINIVDGLWSGTEAVEKPVKWKMAPFNTDWPSSLFASLDQVALESVCLDFLRAEALVNTAMQDRPLFGAVDDHLHQAASSTNWPTGLTYDPEGDGSAMPSLGVHEHWNNSTDKQYSRNLKTGLGIELKSVPYTLVAYASDETNIKDLVTRQITVSPNPATDIFRVQGQFAGETDIEISILTMSGQQVLNQKVRLTSGSLNEVISLPSSASKGTYILKIWGKNSQATNTLIVR